MTRTDGLIALMCAAWLTSLWAVVPPFSVSSTAAPAWIQAFGSVGAILVGFAYVGFQQRLKDKERAASRDETLDFVLELLSANVRDMDDALSYFETAHQQGRSVAPTLSRRSQEVIADELLTMGPAQLGTLASLEVRRAAYWSRAFADAVNSSFATERSPSAETVDTMKRLQAGVKSAAARLRELQSER